MGGLTWRAGPARGPGRAAAPSRASRRGEDRPRGGWGGGGGGGAPAPAGLSAGPGRGRRRVPPAARCAALQPRRRPPGSALRAPLRAAGEEGESWASLLRLRGGEGLGAGSYLPAQGPAPPAPPRGLSASGGARTAEANPRICLPPRCRGASTVSWCTDLSLPLCVTRRLISLTSSFFQCTAVGVFLKKKKKERKEWVIVV